MALHPPALGWGCPVLCPPPRDARAPIFGQPTQLLCSERNQEEKLAEVGSGEVHACSWGFAFLGSISSFRPAEQR